MMTLDEYKNYLINFSSWNIDNNKEAITARKELLNKLYSDTDLTKIIIDTYDFANAVLISDKIKWEYYEAEVNDYDNCFFINLRLTGGYYSDKIYIDANGRYISEYLLTNIFGKNIQIEIRVDEYERELEDDILSYDYKYFLYIQGIPSNLDSVSSSLKDNPKILIK